MDRERRASSSSVGRGSSSVDGPCDELRRPVLRDEIGVELVPALTRQYRLGAK